MTDRDKPDTDQDPLAAMSTPTHAVQDAALNLDAWRERLHDQAVIDGANAISEQQDREATAWTLTVLHGLANLDETEQGANATHALADRTRATTVLIQVITLMAIFGPATYGIVKIIQAFQ